MHDCGACAHHAVPPGRGVEPVERDQAAPGHHHCHGGTGHRVHVEERQRCEHTVLARTQRAAAAHTGIPAATFEEPGLRHHAAFRQTGGPGCIEQIKGVFGIHGLGWTLGGSVRHQFVPPVITACFHVHMAAGALVHQYILNGRAIRKGGVDVLPYSWNVLPDWSQKRSLFGSY